MSEKSCLIDEVMGRIASRHASSGATLTPADASTKSEQYETLIRCLRESTQGVFATMCGWDVVASSTKRIAKPAHLYDVTGVIGLTGKLKVTIAVSFPKEFLFEVTEAFLGNRPTEIDSDAIDLVGELTNMIGGNAKERINLPGVSLGLPTVVAGQGHYIAFESDFEVTYITFESEKGEFCVEVGMSLRGA